MNKIISLALLFTVAPFATAVYAETGNIHMTQTAPSLFLLSSGSRSGQTGFIFNSSDFPSGSLNPQKTLTQVDYQIAAYPQSFTDTVELCYFRPYTADPARCIPVTSGSSGSTTSFNDLDFDVGSQLSIRHTVTGTPGATLHPSRQEAVTTEFTY